MGVSHSSAPSHPHSTWPCRLAQALNVSLDYLAVENVPRRPLHVEDHGLVERLGQLAELDEDDRQSLLYMLNALLTRKRLRVLADDGR